MPILYWVHGTRSTYVTADKPTGAAMATHPLIPFLGSTKTYETLHTPQPQLEGPRTASLFILTYPRGPSVSAPLLAVVALHPDRQRLA